ncbi:hypothetical protein C8Q80DRAFT_1194668 [Daedaleopsis nitida]|nr:hypothetical protein C8Q80DRAFT_1194668 [Daedaleopsis nitida]
MPQKTYLRSDFDHTPATLTHRQESGCPSRPDDASAGRGRPHHRFRRDLASQYNVVIIHLQLSQSL